MIKKLFKTYLFEIYSKIYNKFFHFKTNQILLRIETYKNNFAQQCYFKNQIIIKPSSLQNFSTLKYIPSFLMYLVC